VGVHPQKMQSKGNERESSVVSDKSSDIPSESEEIISSKDINGLGKKQLKMKIE
jgi:hypothetical protein